MVPVERTPPVLAGLPAHRAARASNSSSQLLILAAACDHAVLGERADARGVALRDSEAARRCATTRCRAMT
jgi:hypothetical protein